MSRQANTPSSDTHGKPGGGDGHIVVVPRANIVSIVLATIEAADEYYG